MVITTRMTVGTASIVCLELFDCISQVLHNIVDYSLTKSKQYCIRLMAQHDGLSYYYDCVFGFIKWRCFIVVFWWLRTVYNMDSLGSILINSHRVLSMILWQSGYLFYEDRHVVDTSSCWMDGPTFIVT
jgi:hypothetical protein